jgi:hypothetical protein
MAEGKIGRPLKMSADWFPHQANASAGRTVAILENRFGSEGYAAWFKLLEIITCSRNHIVDVRNSDSIEFLAARMRLQPDRLQEILAKIADLEAIDKDLWASGIIWCQNLVDNLASLYDRRRQDLPHKPEVSAYQNPVSADNNPLSVVRNTTEREIKRLRPPLPPKGFDVFWSAYPKKRSKGQAERAFWKIAPDEQLLATMLAMIERAKKSEGWTKEGGRFIPHPATWLNAKGWEDEIKEQDESEYTGR